MSEVITYALVAIVILVLVLAIVLGLAKAGRARKSAAAAAKAERSTGPTAARPGHVRAGERENNLPDLKIRGTVNNGSKKKIGKIIDKHPDEAITLIRYWLHGNENQRTG